MTEVDVARDIGQVDGQNLEGGGLRGVRKGVFDALEDHAGREAVDGNLDVAVLLERLALGSDHLEVGDLGREVRNGRKELRLGRYRRERRGVYNGPDVTRTGGAAHRGGQRARAGAVAVELFAVEDEDLKAVHLRFGAGGVRGDSRDTGPGSAGALDIHDDADLLGGGIGRGVSVVCV